MGALANLYDEVMRSTRKSSGYMSYLIEALNKAGLSEPEEQKTH
jgi:hypothetical protein